MVVSAEIQGAAGLVMPFMPVLQSMSWVAATPLPLLNEEEREAGEKVRLTKRGFCTGISHDNQGDLPVTRGHK